MKKSIGAKPTLPTNPVFIVCTYDNSNKPNAMAVSWGGICCSTPPCIAISLREETYSHNCLLNKRAFTINIPSIEHIKESDYFGIESGNNKNKFNLTNLTPIKSKIVDAPFIDEFPFIIECELKINNKLGTHTMFIGEIKDIKIDEEYLNNENLINIKKLNPFLYSHWDSHYYSIGKKLNKAFSAGKIFKKD